jgi:nicotinate-nucleotide adenylyltransferase
VEALDPGARERVHQVSIPGVALAARELRDRVRRGQPIRYLVPPEVERYIHARKLYAE